MGVAGCTRRCKHYRGTMSAHYYQNRLRMAQSLSPPPNFSSFYPASSTRYRATSQAAWLPEESNSFRYRSGGMSRMTVAPTSSATFTPTSSATYTPWTAAKMYRQDYNRSADAPRNVSFF